MKKTTPTQEPSIQTINWVELVIFYVVAVVVSAPFRLRLVNMEDILPLPFGLNIFYHVLRGIGPLAGFIVVYYLLKSRVERKISFWGRNRFFSLLAILVIPVGLTMAGVQNDFELSRNYYGMLTGLMLILYALAEEYGWRAYLQEALAPLPIVWRILIIAVLWYLWHLNFIIPPFNIKMQLIHFLALLLGAWGLLKISESTYSVLFVAAVHLSFNLMSDVACGFRARLIILSFSVLLWIVLIKLLTRKNIV
jgi:membrane protease YdiL (CAAX protease family)